MQRGFPVGVARQMNGTAVGIDDAFIQPHRPLTEMGAKLRGMDGVAQFPVGLTWATTTAGGVSTMASTPRGGGSWQEQGGRCVLLSWGHDDVETYVSSIPLHALLAPAMMTSLT